MTTPPEPRLSKSQIKKAGDKVRAFHRSEVDEEEYEHWRKVVIAYRKQFEKPLISVNSSLRYYLDRGGFEGTVTQRLKRLPTIINKLTSYESQMNLARMRDIGGCRIVTNSRKDVYAIADYLTTQSSIHITSHHDYIEQPRESGYRALHLVIERNDIQIETQIRNQAMHDWAQDVEHFSGLLGENFK